MLAKYMLVYNILSLLKLIDLKLIGSRICHGMQVPNAFADSEGLDTLGTDLIACNCCM